MRPLNSEDDDNEDDDYSLQLRQRREASDCQYESDHGEGDDQDLYQDHPMDDGNNNSSQAGPGNTSQARAPSQTGPSNTGSQARAEVVLMEGSVPPLNPSLVADFDNLGHAKANPIGAESTPTVNSTFPPLDSNLAMPRQPSRDSTGASSSMAPSSSFTVASQSTHATSILSNIKHGSTRRLALPQPSSPAYPAPSPRPCVALLPLSLSPPLSPQYKVASTGPSWVTIGSKQLKLVNVEAGRPASASTKGLIKIKKEKMHEKKAGKLMEVFEDDESGLEGSEDVESESESESDEDSSSGSDDKPSLPRKLGSSSKSKKAATAKMPAEPSVTYKSRKHKSGEKEEVQEAPPWKKSTKK